MAIYIDISVNKCESSDGLGHDCSDFHQVNMAVKCIPLKNPILYSKTVPIFLIFYLHVFIMIRNIRSREKYKKCMRLISFARKKLALH